MDITNMISPKQPITAIPVLRKPIILFIWDGKCEIGTQRPQSKCGCRLGFGPSARISLMQMIELHRLLSNYMYVLLLLIGFKFTFGKFGTHVGYELLDPQLNKNYSMSYMFTNGPFSHTGFKANLTKGKHGFMLGVSNATDYAFHQLTRLIKNSSWRSIV